MKRNWTEDELLEYFILCTTCQLYIYATTVCYGLSPIRAKRCQAHKRHADVVDMSHYTICVGQKSVISGNL
jgi:hypothetical protein